MTGNLNDGTSSWWKSNAVFVVFFVLTCAFFYDTLFLGKVIMARDAFADFIPKLALAKRAFADFSVPLWNPQTGCGHPFIADPYTAAIYPLNAIFYVLPPAWGLRLTFLLHLMIAGTGMILLARQWGLRDSAALLMATAFVFSTNLAAMLEFFNILFPVCWGPLLLYFGAYFYAESRRAEEEGGDLGLRFLFGHWKKICLLTLCFALCYLSGNPQYLAFAIGLVILYYAGRLIHDRKPRVFLTGLSAFLFAGGVSLLLCMPQILPFLELLGTSTRSAAIDPGYDKGSIEGRHLWTLLLPYLLGSPGGVGAYWGGTVFEFWLGTFYVGILPLVLGVFAFIYLRKGRSRDSHRWFFLVVYAAVCSLVGLLLAAGDHLPVYDVLFKHLPGFDKVRWPSRFMLFSTYFLPLLGAIGWHRLLEKKEAGEEGFRTEWIVVGVLGVLVVLSWGLYLALGEARAFSLLAGPEVEVNPDRLLLFRRDALAALGFFSAFVVALAMILRIAPGPALRRWETVVVLLGFANVALVSRQVQPVSDEDVYGFTPPLWADLEKDLGEDRHWRFYSIYAYNQFELYGIKEPEVYEIAKTVSAGETWLQGPLSRLWRSSLAPARYYIFHQLISKTTNETGMKFIELMNGKFVLGGLPWDELIEKGRPIEVQFFLRENALPRAFLADDWETPADFNEGLGMLADPGFDIHAKILLETAEGGEIPRIRRSPGAAQGGEIKSIVYDWNRVDLEVESAGDCMLVLLDSWYPGWEATVNGVEVPIFRANLLFRAVEVPAGSARVEFRYRPVRWRAGLGLCGAGLLVMGLGRRAERLLPARPRRGGLPEGGGPAGGGKGGTSGATSDATEGFTPGVTRAADTDAKYDSGKGEESKERN